MMTVKPAAGFIEIIGRFTDGENVDALISVAQIVMVRPDACKDQETIIEITGREPLVRAYEPYAVICKKITEACDGGN